MPLYLIQGPAGAGKSAVTRSLLESGEIDVVADITGLWAAFGQVVRGPDGRFPERDALDPALELAQRIQATAATRALESGHNVAVTTSRPDQVERWQEVADAAGEELRVQTVNPGEEVVRARLADSATGILSDACDNAVRRWFG